MTSVARAGLVQTLISHMEAANTNMPMTCAARNPPPQITLSPRKASRKTRAAADKPTTIELSIINVRFLIFVVSLTT